MALVQRGGRSYFYRSVRRGGRVTSEYLGSGDLAGLMAQLADCDRGQREAERQAWRAERRRLDAEERDFAAYFDDVEALARAALVAAGYHQHKRGEWRKAHGKS